MISPTTFKQDAATIFGMSESNSIQVSIGLPVFNGGATLTAAIESLLQQTHSNFVLYISDNFSSDSTQAICSAFMARDPRIVYSRQEHCIAAADNFRFVLAQANSDYFLWAAADDQRSPNYLEVNIGFLEANPDFVASTSPTRYVDGEFDEHTMGDVSLEGDLEDRFIRFFSTWHANGRFYSLFRRRVIAECAVKDKAFFGSDWAIVLRCLLRGKFKRTHMGWTLLGRNGISRRKNVFQFSRTHWYERFVPLFFLTRVALSLSETFSPRARTKVFFALLRLNAASYRTQLKLALRSPKLDS